MDVVTETEIKSVSKYANAPRSKTSLARLQGIIDAGLTYTYQERLEALATCTPRQRAFARAYVQCGSGVKAYQETYGAGRNIPYFNAAAYASHLLANPRVKIVIYMLSQDMLSALSVSKESILSELTGIVDDHTQRGVDRVKALELAAKLQGLLIERQELEVRGGITFEYVAPGAPAPAIDVTPKPGELEADKCKDP